MKSRSHKSSLVSSSRKSDRRTQQRLSQAVRNVHCEPLENRQYMTVVFGNFPAMSTSDNGGAVINNPKVELVFWGPNWGGAPSALSNSIASKYQSILTNGYLSGLRQYRGGIGNGFVWGQSFVSDNTPPSSFNNGNVDGMLKSEMSAGHVPDPTSTGDSNMFYFVVPQSLTSSPGLLGEHTFDFQPYFHNIFDFGVAKFHYGWTVNDGNMDTLTDVFSHELTEATSDAEGDAVQVNPRDGSSWNEICDGTAQSFSYRVNGILEQSYFSQADHAFIVPDGNSENFFLSDNGGTLTINGDQLANQNDTINVGRNLSGGVMVTMNGQTVSFDPGEVSHVVVNPRGGTDTINVLATVVPTDINGGGTGTINVGDANGVQDINATLNIENSPSFFTVNVNDSGDATARTATLSTFTPSGDTPWGRIHGLAPADIQFENADVNGLNITTGSGADTVNVQQLGDASRLGSFPVQISAEGSGTTMNVGDGTGVQNIFENLTMRNPPAHNVVNVNDNNDRTARTVTFHTTPGSDGDDLGTITGLAPADISYEYFDTSSVNVTLGVGGDTVNVQDTGVATNITGGGVIPIILNPLASSARLIPIPILLVGGDNTINIGHNGSTQSINGTLTIDNPYGQNTVNVNDGSDRTGRTVTLDSTTSVPNDSAAYGTINGMSPAQIRYEYSDTSAINFLMGVGGNTVNVHATGCPTSFDGGAVPIIIGLSAATSRINIVPIPLPEVGGPDTYNITDSGSMQRINGALNIENAHGQNTITMDDSADATGRSITLSSFTPAGDTLWQKVQGLAPADVNFENADASANPVTLRAGTGSDTLTVLGAGSSDSFGLAAGQVTHGGVTVAYSGVENLTLNTGTFNASNDLGALNVSALTSNTSVGFGASQNLASLTVNAANAQLTAGGSKVLSLNALSILGGGKLDLCDNAMQVHYGGGSDPMASIRSWISGGYAGGAFNGAGLCTSSADADHGLGYADSADGVVSGLAANTVLVKYARYGDTNLDGHVNFADLLLQAQNYGKHPGTSTWDQGDCNYDGNVNFADLLKLAQEYGK